MKVLIVDDVAGWLRFHKNNIEYLNINNIQIDTAENASQALSKIEVSIDEPYDVIFTDMQMESNFLPKLAGEWLIEQIQMFDEYKNSRIVIISASASIESIAKKYGVSYISKYLIRNSDSEIYRQFFE
ncbi:response regulator [bacterium]|nr:response regulator [bacterium]